MGNYNNQSYGGGPARGYSQGQNRAAPYAQRGGGGGGMAHTHRGRSEAASGTKPDESNIQGPHG